MKKLAVVLLAFIAFSCSDPEIKDELTGRWEYNSIDVSNSKAVIKASFTIGEDYSIKDPLIVINGIEFKDFTGKIVDPVRSDKLGSVIFEGPGKIITFYNCDKLLYQPAWTIDSVRFQGTKTFRYYWQSLKAF